MVSPLYLFVGTLSWPFVRGLYRLRVRGLEHLPEGGFVLAANHTSNFDPWPLGIPLLPHRQLRFMAKSELFNPVLAPLLRAGGAFKVRRGEGDLAFSPPAEAGHEEALARHQAPTSAWIAPGPSAVLP